MFIGLRWPAGLFLAVLTACAPSPEPELTPRPTLTLAPFIADTATPTQATVLPASSPSASPAPTATPFTHTIRRGDTMLGLAIQYGVELADLLAANPELNPSLLSVGQLVVIPLPGVDLTGGGLPTATPVPFALSAVSCYPVPTGGLWCLTLVEHDLELAIEGVAAQVLLLDRNGSVLATGTAEAPLSLIRPSERRILAAFFSETPSGFYSAFARPLTSVEAGSLEERYGEVLVELQGEGPGADGLSWKLRGRARLASAPEAGFHARVTLLGIGFDKGGVAVGFAMWEAETASDEELAFELTLFSLGPEIATVEVWPEARLMADEISPPSP